METTSKLLVWIPAIPLMAAAVNIACARFVPRWLTHALAVGSVAASFAVAVVLVRPDLPLVGAGPLWDLWRAFEGAGGAGGETLGGLTQTLFTWIEVGSLEIDL